MSDNARPRRTALVLLACGSLCLAAACSAAHAVGGPSSTRLPTEAGGSPSSSGPSPLCSRLPEVDKPVGTLVAAFHLRQKTPTALLSQIAAGRRAATQLATAAGSAGNEPASKDFLGLVDRLDALTNGIHEARGSRRFTRRLRHLADDVGAALTAPAVDMECPLTF